jgi:gamma-glutamylcyclotransferase (GGCT)/AIG2-like uncharacterized protein YtfP
MDRAHMRKMCPQAEPMGLAEIDHHAFFISHGGYGSIGRKRLSSVKGVLWKISARDLVALDAYEAVGDGLYQHAFMPVKFEGKLMKALVYVANDPRPGRCTPKYRDIVLNAARSWELPADYLCGLEKALAAP